MYFEISKIETPALFFQLPSQLEVFRRHAFSKDHNLAEMDSC